MDDIKPTPESIEVAQGLISKVLDDPDCPLGWKLERVIAEYLTRNDRELTRWVNQEIREKTECLQRSFVVEAERRMDAQLKIDALQAAVRRHRDERGDDRCWMDDERLYDEALPEGCGDRADRRLHCPEEMMRHCRQFIASRQPEGEPYVSPQREIDRLRAALEKVNEIRNSIIGLQTVNWSEHIYPLVKVLDDAGFAGMAFSDAGTHYGTMLDRTLAAEAEAARLRGVAGKAVAVATRMADLAERGIADRDGEIGRLQGITNEATTTGIEIADIAEKEIDRLRAALERIACRYQGEVGPHMEEPRAAAIAREVLG